MGVLFQEIEGALPTPSRAGKARPCPSCRSSMPTSPPGSGAGSRRGPGRAADLLARRQLAGAPPPSGAAVRSSPAARAAPPRRAAAARLDGELARDLAAFCRHEDVTPFMTLPRRLRSAPRPAGEPVGGAGGESDRQPHPPRDRGSDRLLRQTPWCCGCPWGPSAAGRASGICWAGCGRWRSTPIPTGPALRAGWSRRWRPIAETAAPAMRADRPLAALPGDVRAPERAGRRARRCRASPSTSFLGGRRRESRPVPAVLRLSQGISGLLEYDAISSIARPPSVCSVATRGCSGERWPLRIGCCGTCRCCCRGSASRCSGSGTTPGASTRGSRASRRGSQSGPRAAGGAGDPGGEEEWSYGRLDEATNRLAWYLRSLEWGRNRGWESRWSARRS